VTILEALAILEAAVLECKKRDINTPDVKTALDFLEPLALKFHETKDLKVRDEIYRLCRELIKLDEPWRFIVI
jgi:hypothetical protein